MIALRRGTGLHGAMQSLQQTSRGFKGPGFCHERESKQTAIHGIPIHLYAAISTATFSCDSPHQI